MHHVLEPMMQRARAIRLGAHDRVSESIKWKTPTFACTQRRQEGDA
jgi:hypothetical protein